MNREEPETSKKQRKRNQSSSRQTSTVFSETELWEEKRFKGGQPYMCNVVGGSRNVLWMNECDWTGSRYMLYTNIATPTLTCHWLIKLLIVNIFSFICVPLSMPFMVTSEKRIPEHMYSFLISCIFVHTFSSALYMILYSVVTTVFLCTKDLLTRALISQVNPNISN